MEKIKVSKEPLKIDDSVKIKIGDEFKGKKVLIADDCAMNTEVLKDVLRPFQFEFSTFLKSSEALFALEETKFDLIILDVLMPAPNGFQLAKEIREGEINSKTPIIFISAAGGAEHKIEGYNFGSLAYIEKPIDPNTLPAQIYGIMKAQKLNTELLFEKENFMAMLTHDLKTPVRAQIRALDLLLNDTFGKIQPQQREILEEIMASNKFMQNMAENVLTNYKTENGSLKIKKAKNSLVKTIEDTVEGLKFLISKRKQTVRVEYSTPVSEEKCDFTGFYDEIEIKRVITNLLVNASEYSPENSVIEILTEKAGNMLQVTVSDSGAGILPKDGERLFLKYSSNSKNYKKVGTGLGLYICKAITEAHGGKIFAHKNPKGGASFTFTLQGAA